MEEIAENVYDYIKSFTEEKGFPPTIQQAAEALNIKKYEAEEAFEQLKESGRIKITDIPRKTTIEFVERV